MDRSTAQSTSAQVEPPRNFPAASSLTSLCLARDDERHVRHLAWAASVCALFLAVGLFGFRSSRGNAPRAGTPQQFVPVTITVPENEPKPAPVATPVSPSLRETAPLPAPQVIPAVAPYSPGIAFPVPVKVAAVLVLAREAAPVSVPSPAPVAPPGTRFRPGTESASTPQPEYPRLALQRGYEGTVVVKFTVEPSGAVSEVELAQGSGFAMLDEAALDGIRKRWRFAPGATRHHFVEIIFQLKK